MKTTALISSIGLLAAGCSVMPSAHNAELRAACDADKGGSACAAYAASVSACEKGLAPFALDWSKRNCDGLN